MCLLKQKYTFMYTTTLPEQSIGACSSIKPEWLRLPDAIRASGVGRSTLYKLIGTGDIKSVCLRKRGCQRGIRLISADSLRTFIESFGTGGSASA
jgi:hypothetical protein